MNKPLRGEIWMVRLDPTEGREQAKTRPCLVISNNKFNKSTDLIIAAPLTSKQKDIPSHIRLTKDQAGLSMESFIMPEHIRSLSINRYVKCVGKVTEEILVELQQKLAMILDFE